MGLAAAQEAPAPPVAPAPRAAAVRAAPTVQVVEVEAGIHKLLREAGGVERVAVGDPKIADVNVVNRREILITGKALGITSLFVWSGGVAREYRLRVLPAKDPLAPVKAQDPEFSKAQIEPGRSVSGQLPNLLAHRRARTQAQQGAKDAIADSSQVILETQVMTEIKIAEVSRQTMQQYGLNVFKNTGNTLAGIGGPGSVSGASYPGFPYSQPSFVQSTNAQGQSVFIPNPNTGATGVFGLNKDNLISAPLASAFNLVFGSPQRGLLGILSLLESKGLARTLAEPSLVAMSGQTASFLAGGEFPIPVSQGSGGGLAIEYKEFGVRLSITPTILSRERIALKVAPEVSDLNFGASVSIGGAAVPSLIVRRTDTTVELGDNESFVISGLVSSNLSSSVDKVPWLGDLPILGAFFKSNTFAREDKELIMVVTPRLVRPLSSKARLPALPGAGYDRYEPSMGDTVFDETGDFDAPKTGFSR